MLKTSPEPNRPTATDGDERTHSREGVVRFLPLAPSSDGFDINDWSIGGELLSELFLYGVMVGKRTTVEVQLTQEHFDTPMLRKCVAELGSGERKGFDSLMRLFGVENGGLKALTEHKEHRKRASDERRVEMALSLSGLTREKLKELLGG